MRLNASSWMRTVCPGTHVYMSVNIPRNVGEILPGDSTLQRRMTIAEHRRTSKRRVWEYRTCPDCGLQFFAMPRLEASENSIETVERPPTTSLRTTTTPEENLKPPEVKPESQHLKPPEVSRIPPSYSQRQQWQQNLSPSPSPEVEAVPPPRSLGSDAGYKRRLLSLNSGNPLPFKRMHVFGRAERKSSHEAKKGTHSTVSLQYARTVHDPSYETEVTTAAGGGSVDIASYDELHAWDGTPIRPISTAPPGRDPIISASPSGIRCDDTSYHIRPIISMVTLSDRVRSWVSKAKKSMKPSRVQTLTCQFAHCGGEFYGWEDLNRHLREDHQLDNSVPVVSGGSSPATEKTSPNSSENTARDNATPPGTVGVAPQRPRAPIIIPTTIPTTVTHQQDVYSQQVLDFLPMHSGSFYSSEMPLPYPETHLWTTEQSSTPREAKIAPFQDPRTSASYDGYDLTVPPSRAPLADSYDGYSETRPSSCWPDDDDDDYSWCPS
ncbi:hypothetical protein K458DRAFT_2138 [Lentithecium fluviatile CBS 122367]|uniref:C2H2-type domain-containing protein n=1 Tax=Lentithecium fluviatile CBS 122367 TaxID=1168545 RepID=A0A6G1JLV9_9PLEO|nr:hypothetical protein K458DRAFT_2138 [Lentithecium fluviatile CBS 122367]